MAHLISPLELLEPCGRLRAHGLAQVPEGRLGSQVQVLRGVVGENPREHRVLKGNNVMPSDQRHRTVKSKTWGYQLVANWQCIADHGL